MLSARFRLYEERRWCTFSRGSDAVDDTVRCCCCDLAERCCLRVCNVRGGCGACVDEEQSGRDLDRIPLLPLSVFGSSMAITSFTTAQYVWHLSLHPRSLAVLIFIAL